MERKILAFIITASCIIFFFSCNTNRSNTKREMDATYVEEGDTINPTEGQGEGTTGRKFMELSEENVDSLEVDSTAINEP